MKKLLALIMALATLVCCFAGCSNENVIVAEKESAGESVAKEHEDFKDYKYTGVDTQAKALMEVKAGTADVAIVDYIMALGSIGEGTDYEELVIDGEGYAEEFYGIAFRKGSDFTAKVNETICELKEDGTLEKIAKNYKLEKMLVAPEEFDEFKKADKDSDYDYIMEKETLIIGITEFAPMNYKDEKGNWTGFETDFAKAVCEKLGIKAEFQVISWNAKETELASKNIDCIWNGMTINDERKANMSISIPYMQNKQVKIVKK